MDEHEKNQSYETNSSNAAASQSTPKNNQPNTTSQGQSQKPSNKAAYDYKVQSAADSGNSTCLKLKCKDGKEITAYAQKNSPGLKPGACIKNVQMDQKEANFGIYYMLNKYEVAA